MFATVVETSGGRGTSVTMYLPCSEMWPAYAAVAPVFRPAHWYTPPVVKKNHSVPWPPFQTCRNGLHGVAFACERLVPPSIEFTGPVATSAPRGQKLSDFRTVIWVPLQVG